VKPFNRQHPVRAYLNDPRFGAKGSKAFHFGVDVSAPDGTAVFAVEPGTVHLEGGRAVGVVSTGGARSFGYWHIVPAVIHLQQVRARQLLGHIDKGWEHVHFAERQGGRYVNPLRRGALSPFADPSSPAIQRLLVERAGKPVNPDRVTGVVDIVAEAYDQPALRPPPPWDGARVTPALMRWRMAHEGRFVIPWRVAVDFRETMLPQPRFADVYAPGTRQNRPGKPGLYRFWIARRFDSRAFENGGYRVDVEASDLQGNRALAQLPLSIRNRPADL
jgi:hypothetical protein